MQTGDVPIYETSIIPADQPQCLGFDAGQVLINEDIDKHVGEKVQHA